MICILFEFFMLYCSPRVLDSMLIQTVLPIINDETFSLEYLQQIDEDELMALIKSVGFQNKRVKDLKKPLNKLQMNLEERFLTLKTKSGRFMGLDRKLVFKNPGLSCFEIPLIL